MGKKKTAYYFFLFSVHSPLRVEFVFSRTVLVYKGMRS